GSGIGEGDLWFEQSGSDLLIDRLGTSDQVTVAGWCSSNPSAQLAEIKVADGMMLDSGLGQLVQAMATYQAGHATFDPTTASAMPSDSGIQTALAAWHHP